MQTIVFALAGNPNSGKTTVFNNLTGANHHVGNYPGVTVEKKEGSLSFRGRRLTVVDLPGTYSLSAYSIEEIIARNFVIENKPDVVVNIVDASNIERSLYLSTQLMELGAPVVIALNMADMADRRGVTIDEARLSQLLGIPVVRTVGSKRIGMDELLQAVIDTAENRGAYRPAMVNYGREFESELAELMHLVESGDIPLNGHRPRWVALKLLEDDADVTGYISRHDSDGHIADSAREGRNRIQTLFGDTPASLISDRRYGFINGACAEATTLTSRRRNGLVDKIDLAMIHPILGLPIFAFLMWLMFNLTFKLGEKPMSWIEDGVSAVSALLKTFLPEGIFSSLLIGGILSGVGGVIIFLPNIILLFLAIAVLEDTGYIARAAFVMDRLMHKIGLHGKSFIPMLIGFGCSVPALMGSRILEDKKDRLVTMHVTTFMSCGARLPVYVLLAGAFWPRHAGNVIFSIYALGIVTAVVMIKLLRATRFRGMSAPFIMELPPFRLPTFRSLLIHGWERAWLYLRKAGTIVLGISIIMWFLMTFPQKTTFRQDYPALIDSVTVVYETGAITLQEMDGRIAEYKSAMAAERIEYSFAGHVGRFIEPAIKPLGFDWRLGVALFSGFAAKEVVVATMGTTYGVGDTDKDSPTLRQKLAQDPMYTPLAAYAFLVFVLLYMPCMTAMSVFLRESGSFKELLFQIGYTTALAWGMAFVVFQGGKLLGLG